MADKVKTKPCIECAEDIPAQALLCKYCKSYQGVRRYLNLSSTVLALLIAFIAVLSNFFQVSDRLSSSPKSDVSIQRLLLTERGLDVIFMNAGTREAIIEKVWGSILFEDANGIISFALNFMPPSEGYEPITPGVYRTKLQTDVMFIGENESDFPKFTVDSGRFRKFPKQEFTVEIRNFDGRAEILRTDLSWDQIDTLISITQRKCEKPAGEADTPDRYGVFGDLTCEALTSEGMRGVTQFGLK